MDEKRPFGISGHLRVKNEELTVAESIESCIEFVDELIITYNDSIDNTEEILLKYAQKYPKKIHLFHYKPSLVVNTVAEIFNKTHSKEDRTEYRDEKNIHNPAYYYNFGYVKTKYSHYMKIDADQIYFTRKFLEIKQKLFIIYILNKISFAKRLYRLLKINKILDKITSPSSLWRLLSDIEWTKNAFYLVSGINILYHNETLCVATKQQHTFPLFINGFAGDHLLYIPNSKVRYRQAEGTFYETLDFKYTEPIIPLGLTWIHCQELKIQGVRNYKDSLPVSISDINGFQSYWFNWSNDIGKKESRDYSEYIHTEQVRILSQFWDMDKRYVDAKFHQRFLLPILKRYQKIHREH